MGCGHQSPSTCLSRLMLFIIARQVSNLPFHLIESWKLARPSSCEFSRRVKVRVDTAARDQLRTAAVLNDVAMLEYDDVIDIVNRGEPMRRDQRRTATHQFLDRFHDRGFCRRIERRGWLIEKQHRRILQKRARDAEALALTNAKMSTTLAHCTLVAVGHLTNELIGLRAPRSIDNLFLR